MPRQKADKRTHSEAFGTNDRDLQNEPLEDDFPATATIVTQPTIILQIGSSTLTVGLATDPTPQCVPHIIAYRGCYSSTETSSNTVYKKNASAEDETCVLNFPYCVDPDMETVRDLSLSKVQESLERIRVGLGIHNTEVNRREYLAYNSLVQPEARESEELSLTDVSNQPHCIIGNEVLYLPVSSGYTVYKPLRYGRLNCLQSPQATSLSRTTLLSMLEDLWTKAFEEYLQIYRRDFKNHRVVLLVSDLIDRTLYKEFMNILLVKLEFAAAFLHQESVCAAYCAGMASCCVVNVGDEVTHISCIEEGISNPNTRLILHYGGSNITRLFYFLIQKTNFPYSKCTTESRLDGVLIQQLKESVCHLDATIWGVREYHFSVISPLPGRLLDYKIKLSDEGIIAAMGVFFPNLFCLPRHISLMSGQEPQTSDREDLLDESPEIPNTPRVEKTKDQSVEEQLTKLMTGHELMPGEVGLPEVTRRVKRVDQGMVLPLDKAIHLSISCTSSLETRSKLYPNILLVGGGLSFPGSSKMLHSHLEYSFPSHGVSRDSIEVHTNVRELDSSHIAWKGGAVLSCLDTCHELWIDKQEWDFSGVRLLRERAPFLW